MIATRVLVPTVVLVADLVGSAATWAAWELSGRDGLAPALAVLVLAAPVGLVAAVLLPGWRAARVGRRLGVGAISAEAPGLWTEVTSLVLDPLTSLTTGRLVVTEVKADDPDHIRNIRWFAGALSHLYDDPVGRAVAKLAGRGKTTDVFQTPGVGIRGYVDQHPVRVGEPAWIGVGDLVEQAPVGTTVVVEVDHRPLGRITVAEEVRVDASRQLDHMRRFGLTPVLASPGEEQTVARVARLAASPTWHAETEPARLASELAVTGDLVGLVHTEEDGATSLVVVDRDPAGAVQERGAIATVDAGIDHLVHALGLAVCLRRTRRRALRTTAALMLLTLPLAALGLLTLPAALVLALLTWLVVAGTAVSGFSTVHLPGENG